MTWDYFVPFSIAALHFWGFGAFAAWRGRKPYVVGGLTLIGLAIFFCFIVGMWISLERPPMRTMGETRLWYSFFLPLAGLITYSRLGCTSSVPCMSMPKRTDRRFRRKTTHV